VSVLRVAEASAWIIGALLLGWMLLDAWRTNKTYDENLLLSSREGEIEKDLREVESDLEEIEARVDGLAAPDRASSGGPVDRSSAHGRGDRPPEHGP
jgi:hypothetical protein